MDVSYFIIVLVSACSVYILANSMCACVCACACACACESGCYVNDIPVSYRFVRVFDLVIGRLL